MEIVLIQIIKKVRNNFILLPFQNGIYFLMHVGRDFGTKMGETSMKKRYQKHVGIALEVKLAKTWKLIPSKRFWRFFKLSWVPNLPKVDTEIEIREKVEKVSKKVPFLVPAPAARTFAKQEKSPNFNNFDIGWARPRLDRAPLRLGWAPLSSGRAPNPRKFH